MPHPELHSLLQLAGWGFGGWSEHLLRPDEPFRYRRPMPAFYDDNVEGIIPSLSTSTLVAHVRAAGYDAGAALVDENCHPFHFEGRPWLVVHNGAVPGWQVLQRELLQVALVAPNRIIGVNIGAGPDGDTDMDADWRELREAGPGTPEHQLSMVLEPLYLLTGRDFQDYEKSYDINVTSPEDANSAILSSEPLTEADDDWQHIQFGQMVAIERVGDRIRHQVRQMAI